MNDLMLKVDLMHQINEIRSLMNGSNGANWNDYRNVVFVNEFFVYV